MLQVGPVQSGPHVHSLGEVQIPLFSHNEVHTTKGSMAIDCIIRLRIYVYCKLVLSSLVHICMLHGRYKFRYFHKVESTKLDRLNTKITSTVSQISVCGEHIILLTCAASWFCPVRSTCAYIGSSANSTILT